MTKQVYSWQDITDEQIQQILESLYNWRIEHNIIDCDNDYVLDINIADRRNERFAAFQPIPYYNKDYTNNDKIEETLLDNLDVAINELQKHRRQMKINKEYDG